MLWDLLPKVGDNKQPTAFEALASVELPFCFLDLIASFLMSIVWCVADATLLNDQLYPFYQKYQERLEYKRQRKSITAFQMFRYRLVNFLVGVHHS